MPTDDNTKQWKAGQLEPKVNFYFSNTELKRTIYLHLLPLLLISTNITTYITSTYYIYIQITSIKVQGVMISIKKNELKYMI